MNKFRRNNIISDILTEAAWKSIESISRKINFFHSTWIFIQGVPKQTEIFQTDRKLLKNDVQGRQYCLSDHPRLQLFGLWYSWGCLCNSRLREQCDIVHDSRFGCPLLPTIIIFQPLGSLERLIMSFPDFFGLMGCGPWHQVWLYVAGRSQWPSTKHGN